jgi:hypothetical protein
MDQIRQATQVYIQQRRELAELIGFETRNKYEIQIDGQVAGFAAEQQKGVLGFLMRQVLGHWRTFEILIFSPAKTVIARARHPFRFFFQRLEVLSPDGQLWGSLQQRFALLHKKFDLEDASGRVVLEVRSPIWRPWTFPFVTRGQERAVVRKKWGGILREGFTDADRFELEFKDSELSYEERLVLVASALFIDLQYFERKSGG